MIFYFCKYYHPIQMKAVPSQQAAKLVCVLGFRFLTIDMSCVDWTRCTAVGRTYRHTKRREKMYRDES